MPDTNPPQRTPDSGLPSRDLLGIAAMCADTGVRQIGDIEDIEAKEKAYDEWMEGKWEAINAAELKPGDKMRDADGGTVEISAIYAAADDHIYATAKDRLGMHIPKSGVVLILPNATGHPARDNQPPTKKPNE